MYIKKINLYSLTYGEMLIFNSENKILLCNVERKYTFIGGHVEENETLTMVLIREFIKHKVDNFDISNINNLNDKLLMLLNFEEYLLRKLF